jgi:hypothetical protein
MDVRRRVGARIDQRIKPLDGELCASETQETCVGCSKKPRGGDESLVLHHEEYYLRGVSIPMVTMGLACS